MGFCAQGQDQVTVRQASQTLISVDFKIILGKEKLTEVKQSDIDITARLTKLSGPGSRELCHCRLTS